jgi:molybdate transport system substrate-binding protein
MMHDMARSLHAFVVVAFPFLACVAASSAQAANGATVRVGAAVSLKEAVTEVAKAYEMKSGDRVEFAIGSSGQVMSQITGGAPIDAFISAADKQVDELVAAGLVDANSRRVVAGNTLVLVVPRDSKDRVDSFESLARVPVKRIGIGEPKTVPAGQYAIQAIEKLKLTAALSGKLVYGSNVRQVLDYVTRAEVTAGIVYATDARKAGDKVKVVAEASDGAHDPIVYPAVVVKRSRDPAAARRFLDHLATDVDARRILEKHGFTAPAPPASPNPPAPGRRP